MAQSNFFDVENWSRGSISEGMKTFEICLHQVGKFAIFPRLIERKIYPKSSYSAEKKLFNALLGVSIRGNIT